MTYFQTICFIIFGIIFYLIIMDKNVAEYIVLLTKIVKLQFDRYMFMIKYHPKNPITNYIQTQKMNRLALELQREFEQRADS
jgi:hypothetical protein